jgi:ACS family pantothenate transporter-like MFS transporter
MSYPDEKALKNAFITEGSELPVIVKSESREIDAPVYIQSKRTWKSYFWSSESSNLTKDRSIVADQP